MANDLVAVEEVAAAAGVAMASDGMEEEDDEDGADEEMGEVELDELCVGVSDVDGDDDADDDAVVAIDSTMLMSCSMRMADCDSASSIPCWCASEISCF